MLLLSAVAGLMGACRRRFRVIVDDLGYEFGLLLFC